MKQIHLDAFETPCDFTSLKLYEVREGAAVRTIATSRSKRPSRALDMLLGRLLCSGPRDLFLIDTNVQPDPEKIEPVAYSASRFYEVLFNSRFRLSDGDWDDNQVIGCVVDVTLWLNTHSEIVRRSMSSFEAKKGS